MRAKEADEPEQVDTQAQAPSAESRWSPAILLLALQSSSRLVTFSLNQLMIRITGPGLYGFAHIQFELLLSLMLMISREAVRGASMRLPLLQSSPNFETMKLLHLLPTMIGASIGGLVAFWAFKGGNHHPQSQPYFTVAVYLYILAAFLELCAEPLYLYALSPMGGRNLRLRVQAEGWAALAKGLVTLGVTFYAHRQIGSGSASDAGLLSFALGQLAYGTTILAVFLTTHVRSIGLGKSLALYIPIFRQNKTQQGPANDDVTNLEGPFNLTAALFVQSILKFLLNEADKLAVSRLASLEDQGGYALGVNYASLPLRMVFQPLEESARFNFSRHASRNGTEDEVSSKGDRTIAASDAFQRSSRQMAEQGSPRPIGDPCLTKQVTKREPVLLLASLLQLHGILGLMLLAYLPPLAKPFIAILSGPQWVDTSAPRTLGSFAFFLPAAGFSGMLEGFVQSVADAAHLRSYNKAIIASSAAFVIVVAALTSFGIYSTEENLVFASTVSMLVRASAGWHFTRRILADNMVPFKALLPSRHTIVITLVGGLVVRKTLLTIPQFETSLPSSRDILFAYRPVITFSAGAAVASMSSLLFFDCDSLTAIYTAVTVRQ
ncbi:unnamed protein product [Sympodiomycopsis kandeliae]